MKKENGERKRLKKKVTFVNGKESESEIIYESVLKEAESTKIYKGIKIQLTLIWHF